MIEEIHLPESVPVVNDFVPPSNPPNPSPNPLPNPSPEQVQLEVLDDTEAVGLSEPNRKVYNDIVHYLKLKLQRPFTAPKIVMLIASGIKFMGKVKSMKGYEKKDLVIHALRDVIKHSSYIKESEKAEIIMLVDTFADPLIDVLVKFAEDGITFIKSKLKGISWCPSCIRGKDKNADSHDRTIMLSQSRNLEEYKALKDYLKLKLQQPIDAPKIILVLAEGVKFIEHYKDLSGVEKKDVVLHSIKDIILELDLPASTDLIEVIDTFGDQTIDYLVDFGKHMYLKAKKRCL